MKNTPQDPTSSTTIHPELNGIKVLLVEDSAINQKLVTALLEIINVDLDIAQNGQEAIDILQKKRYHLILMDINMPIMDGYEATAIIRADSAFDNTPIVAMTGDVNDSDMEKAKEIGMNSHLAKPFTPQKLYLTIKEQLTKVGVINESH